MKSLEVMFWVVGAALLAHFAGTQAWSEIQRQNDIAAFEQTRPTNPGSDSDAQAITEPSNRQTAAADAVLAILRIPEVALEVAVRYGTDESVLVRGAGLVEGTGRPGSDGNVAIAAHRDSYFRPLKDLEVGDRIELAMPDRTQAYIVTNLSVVEPTDVYVLDDVGEPVLTLVTCYPFFFVGAAPQRYIVRAVATEFSS